MRPACLLAVLGIFAFPASIASAQSDDDALGRILREANRHIGKVAPQKSGKARTGQLKRLMRACETGDLGACQRMLSSFRLPQETRRAVSSKADQHKRARQAFDRDYKACLERADEQACGRALAYAKITAAQRQAITQEQQRQADVRREALERRRRVEAEQRRKAEQQAQKRRLAALIKACEGGDITSCDTALKFTTDSTERDRIRNRKAAILKAAKPKSGQPPAEPQSPAPPIAAKYVPITKQADGFGDEFAHFIAVIFAAGGLLAVILFVVGRRIRRQPIATPLAPEPTKPAEPTAPAEPTRPVHSKSAMSVDVGWDLPNRYPSLDRD